jgi:hypothetical protein
VAWLPRPDGLAEEREHRLDIARRRMRSGDCRSEPAAPPRIRRRDPRCYGRAVPTFVYGDFEWDVAKAAANELKHGVRFEEAAQAFTDPRSVDFADAAHPDRLVTVAMSPESVFSRQ